jgi:hypothetical protein
MTRRVDRLRPKLVRGLVFTKHGSCHLYESTVLPFSHPILLRSIGSQKLMLDAIFISKVLYLSVLEFDAVVTCNLLYFGIKLILCPFQELLYHLLSFTLILQKEHPREARIIINNNNTIFVTTYAYVCNRIKQVYM